MQSMINAFPNKLEREEMLPILFVQFKKLRIVKNPH